MRYLIALLIALVSTSANAGLTYIYWDNEWWEMEGLTFFEILGADAEFNIFAPVQVHPWPPFEPPPVSNDDKYYQHVGGFITPPVGKPVSIEHKCFLRKARFADEGDILLWVDCRDKIFSNGFETP